MTTEKPDEGWFGPRDSRKFHYFRAGRSLCRKWGFPGPLQPDTGKTTPDDCAECSKRLSREGDR